MAVVLRFVDKRGCVVERFLGIKHVACTTAASLKATLENLFSEHSLSISMLRGQGYDGASNMQCEYNGLKALIMKENPSAYYVHCFSHQLQLALVAVARNHTLVEALFLLISEIVNVVGALCKRADAFRDKQVERIINGLENEEIVSRNGLNQERTLVRPCDTRWGSHYGTLNSLISMFDSVVDVLDDVVTDGLYSAQRFQASRLLDGMQCFEFVITLHLMKSILGITNKLSQALQRKYQDIETVMRLVSLFKIRLQMTRDDRWTLLLEEASIFYRKHHISVPEMDDVYVVKGRSARKSQEILCSHRYRIELFNSVINMQLQELNNRFNEASTELLLCVSCFNTSNCFASFDKKKLIRLAEFYPKDFSDVDRLALGDQLENFILDMRLDVKLTDVKGLSDISQKMVETRRNVTYPLVYKLLCLALILPVVTTSVERTFSAMKILKTRLWKVFE